MKQIPAEVQDVLQKAAKAYSDSPATTNAGKWLRFIAKIVPVSVIVKLFAHKITV